MPDDQTRDERELARLVRFLTRPANGFGFALARVDDLRAATPIQQLAIDHSQLRVTTIHLGVGDYDTDLLERLAAAASDSDAVFLTGVDNLLTDTLGRPIAAPALVGLNFRRDALPDQVPVRVVLWISQPGYLLLAKLAWDLLEVTLTRFEFSARAAASIPLRDMPTWDPTPAWFDLVPEDQRLATLVRASHWVGLADGARELPGVADAANSAALLYAQAADFDEARPLFERAIRTYDRVPDLESAARVRLRLAELSWYLGDGSTAEQLADLAARGFGSLGRWRDQAEARSLLARVYVNTDPERAVQLAEALVDDCRSRHDPQLLGHALALLGALHDLRNNWPEAESTLREAIELLRSAGDKPGLAATEDRLGQVLTRSNPRAALDMLHELAPAIELTGDEFELAKLRQRIALAHHGLGQSERALAILEREVLPVYQRSGDQLGLAGLEVNIADLLVGQGRFDEALALLRDHVIPEARAIRAGGVEAVAIELANQLLAAIERSQPREPA